MTGYAVITVSATFSRALVRQPADFEKMLPKLLFGSQSGHCQGQKQYTAEAYFAVFGGVPLGLCVGAAAEAAGAHGQCRNAEGERDIGVCGSEAEIGAEAEMAVDGPQCVKQWGVGGKVGCGAVADFEDGEDQWDFGAGRTGFCGAVRRLDGIFYGTVQCNFKAKELIGAGGAEIDGGVNTFRDGIHAGTAMDGADIERGAGLFRKRCLG
jgi:hypothetical protein